MKHANPQALVILCVGSLVLSATAILLSVVMSAEQSATKIAFVNSKLLIHEYQGMRDAHERLESLSNEWLGQLQEKEEQLQGHQKLIHQAANKGDVPQDLQRDAAASYTEVESLKAKVAQEFQEKEQQLTQGALNQINDFVQAFGAREGYDLVLGTSNSGNVLYGTDAIDITAEVLAELNNVYQGTD